MSKTIAPTQLLIEVLFHRLDPPSHAVMMTQVLWDIIEQSDDETSTTLIRFLRNAYGLDPAVSVEDEAASRDLSVVAIQSERENRREMFANLLMNAYPMGSIRQEGKKNGSEPVPSFMGTRKLILQFVVAEWRGEYTAKEKRKFDFLREALWPGVDGPPLLESEKQMILGIIRERLQDASCFTEPILREWMFRLHRNDWRINDIPFFMLLALARVRNGGYVYALRDIERCAEDERATDF